MSRAVHPEPAFLPAILLVLPLCIASIHAAQTPRRATDPTEQPEARWREGPIRYIITTEEDRQYKMLRTAEERARFIEIFWARRDPDPRSLINEFRMEFWNRVVTANRLFSESSKPGWKTDMGRYYILLGPPDDRDTTAEQGRAFSTTGIRGAVTWLYRRSPGDHIGTGLRLVFTSDASGEWRIATDPAIVEKVLSDQIQFPATDVTSFGIPFPQLPARMTDLELMLDLGRLEEVPSYEDLLTAIVTAEEFYGVVPFSARYDFFAGRQGLTLVAFTLNLHPDPLDPSREGPVGEYLIVGRLDRADTAGESPRFFHESDFVPSTHNRDPDYHGPYIYQAVLPLEPGSYRVSFAAFDRASRRTGTLSSTIDVPRFTAGTLALSSLCLSERIEPVPEDVLGAEPYIIGHLKVTPRMVPSYRNGDTFAVYYQIYGASTAPDGDAPTLRIEYQFFVRHGEEDLPVGRPITFEDVTYPAQGWSFPMHDWPSAEFRLRVTVTDTISGQSATGAIAFRVL